LDPHRSERVAESIREELQELIAYELSDPRIGGANVIEVLLSPDMRHATARLNLDGTPEQQAETLAALDHAKYFLKHQIAERLRLFKIPELHFETALAARLGAKTPHLLRRMRRGRAKSR
jgi:ribosome-binding factor A